MANIFSKVISCTSKNARSILFSTVNRYNLHRGKKGSHIKRGKTFTRKGYDKKYIKYTIFPSIISILFILCYNYK